MAVKPGILVIDDRLDYARIVTERMPEFNILRVAEGESGMQAQNGSTALAFIESHRSRVDLILLDMQFELPEEQLLPLVPPTTLRRTKRFQGLAILRELRRLYPTIPVVVLTAVQDLSLVEAGQDVASQSMTYILEPDDLDALRIRIHTALTEASATAEEDGILWGLSAAARDLRRRLAVTARGPIPVILEGETGTGKSHLAEHFIHPHSGRKGPFIVIDLSTIPHDLVAAHLFGALKGAYTGAVADRKGLFEMAHNGTLFIDEVQNIPLDIQKQLLQVLQDRRVRPLGSAKQVNIDVKLIAASNTSLAGAVASGQFRNDLYMRLSPATLAIIPPLRKRMSDLRTFARYFVWQAGEESTNLELKKELLAACNWSFETSLELAIGSSTSQSQRQLCLTIPTPAWDTLAAHSWPGNLRELAMVMQNLVTFTLVAAVDAIRQGVPIQTPRLQADPGLVATLLAGYNSLAPLDPTPTITQTSPDSYHLQVIPGATLNAVSNDVEKQYMTILFKETGGDFPSMALRLLGDSSKARAVRLRLNQLGLKVRDLR
jgi:DNA-binding NtrC family response regulator